MINKNTLVLLAVIAIVAGAIFVYKNYSLPEKKVERLEQQLENKRETSGYNACMAKVKAENQKWVDCYTQKLKAQGYTDGLDCIMDYENPICSSQNPAGFKRYNAQVYAGNDCAKELGVEQQTLTELDCAKLLD